MCLLPQANILHHCNTGALATVDVGTALGVIYGVRSIW
jgi:methylthioribose-1-phosphate isomerase